MSAKSPNQKSPVQVDLTKLPLDQLLQIKQELEQEISGIQDSLQTLKTCRDKYGNSFDALNYFQPDWKDRTILVPLTSSMYVPGRLKDLDSFVIDIGTGYFIQKNMEGSKDYFKRRVEYVQEQIEKIKEILTQKNNFLQALTSILEAKQMATAHELQQMQTKAS